VRAIGWLLRRYAMAFGVLALACGIGLTVEGEALVGVPLILISIPLVVVPFALMLWPLFSSGFDGAVLGWQRSPAADEAATARRLSALGALLVGVSVIPFLAALALLSVVGFAARDLSVAATLTLAVVMAFLAAVPGLLGYQLVRAGALLRRGYRDATRGAVRLLTILTVLAGILAAMAASDRQHRNSDEFLAVSVPILVVGLLTIGAVAYVDNAVTAAEKRLAERR
jgi:hypothetical protein